MVVTYGDGSRWLRLRLRKGPPSNRLSGPFTCKWRRGWDSNPRNESPRSAVFKTAAFDLSATPPARPSVPTVPAGRSASSRWLLRPASAILRAMTRSSSVARTVASRRARTRCSPRSASSDANRLIVPGGPLPLTRPGSERRVALDCVREIVEVHDVRVIYVVAHQECAAYERALGGLGFDQQDCSSATCAGSRRCWRPRSPTSTCAATWSGARPAGTPRTGPPPRSTDARRRGGCTGPRPMTTTPPDNDAALGASAGAGDDQAAGAAGWEPGGGEAAEPDRPPAAETDVLLPAAPGAARVPWGRLRGRRPRHGRGARRAGRRLQPAHRFLGRLRRRHLPAARQRGPDHQGRPAHGARGTAGTAHLRVVARVDRRGGAGGGGHRPAHVQRRSHGRQAGGRLRVHRGRARHLAASGAGLPLAARRGGVPARPAAAVAAGRVAVQPLPALASQGGGPARRAGLAGLVGRVCRRPTRSGRSIRRGRRYGRAGSSGSSPDGTVKTPPSSEAKAGPKALAR